MLTMHLRNEASATAIEALRNAGQTTQAQLALLKELAKKPKPKDYDDHVNVVADLYAGRQEQHTRDALAARYHNTHQSIPSESLNIVKRIAVEQATAYETAPQRWVTYDGLRPVEGETSDNNTTPDPALVARADSFASVINAARLHRVMLEATRRLMVVPTVFVRVGWQAPVVGRGAVGDMDANGAPVLEVFWPSKVHVVCHHTAPSDLYSALCLIAETSGPDGGTWFEVWRREAFHDEFGALTGFGPWRAERIPQTREGEDDKRAAYPLFGDGEYPLPTLPWVVFHDGMPEHGVYCDEGRDLVAAQLNVNVVSSDALYNLSMGAHRQLVVNSDRLKQSGQSVVFGPGDALILHQGDNASALPSDVNSAPRDHIEQRLRSLAVERRLPPHRFDTAVARVESGISKQVQDIPATKARREREGLYADVEEQYLLPILVEVADYWGDAGIAHAPRNGETPGGRLEGVAFHVAFSGQEEYESKESRERYAAALLDRRAISLARYAQLAGAYATVAAAEEAGLSDEVQPAAPSVGEGLQAFTANLQAGLAAQPVPAADEVTEDGNT